MNFPLLYDFLRLSLYRCQKGPEYVAVRWLHDGKLMWYDTNELCCMKDSDFDDIVTKTDTCGTSLPENVLKNHTMALSSSYRIPFELSAQHVCKILQPRSKKDLQNHLQTFYNSLFRRNTTCHVDTLQQVSSL